MNHLEKIIKTKIPLIDLRAPIEFEKGTFPTSVNIPILSNEQRVKVGIKYKHEGNTAAEELGFNLVKDERDIKVKLWKQFIEENPESHIYCMRGGRRSQIAKSWLKSEKIDVPLIDGGYKALRNTTIEILNSVNNDSKKWIILAGRTGTGKTTILNKFNSTIDLEKHAMHRGSAFGEMEQKQPTPINFENNLIFDYASRETNMIFLEDESRRIGKLNLPKIWHERMQKTPIIIINISLEERINNIVHEYVNKPLNNGVSQKDLNESLQLSLLKIKKRLGLMLYKEIGDSIHDNLINNSNSSHENWVEKLLSNYYDPMYDYQLKSKENRCLLKSEKSGIIKFLTQTESSQSL